MNCNLMYYFNQLLAACSDYGGRPYSATPPHNQNIHTPSSGSKSLKSSKVNSEWTITKFFKTIFSNMKYIWNCFDKIDNAETQKKIDPTSIVVLTPYGFRERLPIDKKDSLCTLTPLTQEHREEFLKLFHCPKNLKHLVKGNIPIAVKLEDIEQKANDPNKKSTILELIMSWRNINHILGPIEEETQDLISAEEA